MSYNDVWDRFNDMVINHSHRPGIVAIATVVDEDAQNYLRRNPSSIDDNGQIVDKGLSTIYENGISDAMKFI